MTDPAARARAILIRAGARADDAELIVDCLMAAERTGHPSHGLMRIEPYVQAIRDGATKPLATTTVLHDGGACIALDADLGFGQVAATECVRQVLARAQAHGIGLATLRHSGHIGRLADWVQRIADAGCVAWAWLNTAGVPTILPQGGACGRLSTNPIAAAFPIPGQAAVVIDLTTSTVAEGKVRLARAKGERIPDGWIVDKDGRPTTDPNDLYQGGALLTFGGHKGYCLSLLVELMAGALSQGAANQPGIVPHNNMTLLAIRPQALGDAAAIAAEARRFTDWVAATPPRDPAKPVRIPGRNPDVRTAIDPSALAALDRAEALLAR